MARITRIIYDETDDLSHFSLFGEGMWAYRLRSTKYLALKATKASSAAVSRAATTAANTASASIADTQVGRG